MRPAAAATPPTRRTDANRIGVSSIAGMSRGTKSQAPSPTPGASRNANRPTIGPLAPLPPPPRSPGAGAFTVNQAESSNAGASQPQGYRAASIDSPGDAA